MIEASTLRILNATGQTIGTGFLVSKTLAVTCAHVVAEAGSVDGDTIQVQFTGRDEKIEALVEPKHWRETKKGDVAFLRLTVPGEVAPLRLGLAEHSHKGNVFRSFGYATAAGMQGIFANGTIDGYQREYNLVQLQSPQANHGISGAPVFDEKRGVVVGMITKGHSELGRNQETTFATPTELIFEICPEIQPSEICPYLGLESFTAETERFFFGRAALTEKLLTTLRGGCRFLAVFGPSGSGKSSVVRAGLLPALAKGQIPGSQKWAQITIRPADDPFAQMKALGLGLRDIDGYLRRHQGMQRIVLFVDQFEELFTLCPDELRDGFVRDLATALDASYLVLVISMRDDFYSAFNAEAAPLAGWAYQKVDVPATLERADLTAMIEKPAAAVGLALEEGLTERILNDATTEGAARSSTLPLLEFALTQLWDKRRDGLLTHDAYQSIGGVTGSLALWAEKAYSDLPKADQLLAESLLTALVHLGDEAQGLPDTRKRRDKAEFDEATQNVITHFTNRRLLVTSGETVELVHDALVREWGRLQGWIKQNRENLRLREGISDAAGQWESASRDMSLLNHRGSRLDDALSLGDNSRYGLTAVEQVYLNACVALRNREQRERERRLRWTVIASITTAVIFLALGSFGLVKSNEATIRANDAATAEAKAEEQANIAFSRQLAAQSISLIDERPDLPLLLAIEGFRLQKNPETEDALLRNIQHYPYLINVLDNRGSSIDDVAIQADGNLLAAPDGKNITLWDITDNIHPMKLLTELTGHLSSIYAIAFHPSKKILASGGAGGVILWDTSIPTQPKILSRLTDFPNDVDFIVFNSTGNLIAVACYEDYSISLWDIRDPQHPFKVGKTNVGDDITSLAFKPNGTILAVSEVNTFENISITLFDFSNLSNITVLGSPIKDSHTRTVLFSPDGTILAEGTDDGNLVLWDASNPANLVKYSETKTNTTLVSSMAFKPNSNLLITGSENNSLAIWDVSKPSEPVLITELGGHTSNVHSIGFSQDGHVMVSAGNNVLLWNITKIGHYAQMGQVIEKPIGFADVLYSPDGSTLVASTDSGNTLVWNVKWNSINSNQVTQVADLKRVSGHMAFSPDGNILAITGLDKTIMLWDFSNPNFPQKIGASLISTGDVYKLAFSPSDQVLASGGADKQVTLWDIRNPITPVKIGVLDGFDDLINSFEFSPDGTVLAVSDYAYNLMLWDVKDYKNLKRLSSTKFSDTLYKVVFHPKHLLLALQMYNQVQFLDISNPSEPKPIGLPFPEEPNRITNFTLSPDGNTLVSANNQLVVFWDISDPSRPVQIGQGFPVPNGTINDFSFKPDGKVLVSGSQHDPEFIDMGDGSLRYIRPQQDSVILWDVTVQSWFEQACQRVGRNLTRVEWKQYLPGKEYQASCLQWPLEPEPASIPSPTP